MTEKEFRDGLKKCVGSTGLSSQRQMQVLMQMKGAETKVRSYNKFRVVIALAVVLMFSMGAAIAAEIIDYVNWEGKAVDAPQTPLREDQKDVLARMQELMTSLDESITVIVTNPDAREAGTVSAAGTEVISEHFDDLEEMAQRVRADGNLPWPEYIPEEYTFMLAEGLVKYFCAENGNYELVDQWITEDGFYVNHLTIPEEYRRVDSYRLLLTNEDYSSIDIYARTYPGDGFSGVHVDEESQVTALTVEGMENVLLIKSAEQIRLVLRKTYDVPIKKTEAYFSGAMKMEDIRESEGYTMEISTTDTNVTADELLALFGLKAK